MFLSEHRLNIPSLRIGKHRIVKNIPSLRKVKKTQPYRAYMAKLLDSNCRSSYTRTSSAPAWSGPMRHRDPLSTSQGVTFMARGGAFICPCVSVVSVSALFGFCAAALTARESDLQRSFRWTRLSLSFLQPCGCFLLELIVLPIFSLLIVKDSEISWPHREDISDLACIEQNRHWTWINTIALGSVGFPALRGAGSN